MKAARIALLALACALPLVASAQWIWVDKDGRKVFSDRAPSPDIPAERIVKAPKGVALPAPSAAPATVAAAPSEAAADKSGATPKPAGKDKSLEERRKQLAAAEADKRKAEQATYVALRNDNCSRAKAAKAGLDTGARITRFNSQGEREYLSDSDRTAEVKRLNDVITRDCAPQ
ncbi:MAG: DUF4124 domain-containing protein [Burkholderiales bacterium]